MKRKTHRNTKIKIKKYTAFVPKTIKATKKTGSIIIRSINNFLTSGVKSAKRATKYMDQRVAKSIRSITKKRKY
jgi:hypothetical protein